MSLGEQQLRELGVAFSIHEYDYRKKGAEAAAAALGVPLSAALKTLVVRLSDDRDVFVLVAGDRSVSMRNLARALGVKSASLASERDTERLTGYRVGGIGPFGSRTKLSFRPFGLAAALRPSRDLRGIFAQTRGLRSR